MKRTIAASEKNKTPAPGDRVPLTLGRITSFTCPPEKKQVFLWDEAAPRLSVRATTGSKSFVFESKLNGQTIRRTIGDIQNWNLDTAREEARRLQTLIDQGIDPRELDREKSEAKEAAKAAKVAAQQIEKNRQRYTLRALCDAYTELLLSRGKAQSARQAISIFKCHVFEANADIAALPAGDITAHQAAAMIRKVAEQGKDRAAGILRSYLLAAYNTARKAPFNAKIPSQFIEFEVDSNPVEPVSTIAVKRGERTLSSDELKLYLQALGNDLADQALKLALYAGGQRMAQLLRAKISDYNPDTTTLRLWDTKGKRQTAREHLLPLATEGVLIIENLITRARKQEEASASKERREPIYSSLWLFSSHGKTQLVDTTPGKRAAEISRALKGEPFDLRDIRRTAETMLAGMGISKDTRAQLLSHGLSGVQAAHYDRHSYTNEKRAALTAWEARLQLITTNESAAENIINLPARANG